MSIYNNAPLTKIPGYLTAQVHPENEVLPIIKESQKALGIFQKLVWSSYQNSLQASEPPLTVFQNTTPGPRASLLEKYHFEFTQRTINYFQQILASFMPPETIGYHTALNYVETRLLPLKITELTPDAFLEIINRINLCLNQLNFRDVYRTSATAVYTENMPKQRNRSTFPQVDRFILSNANIEQQQLWKTTTRAKVWKLCFAEENQTPTFDEREIELLKGLVCFTPNHEEIPALMNQFAIDFCAKVAANEELDSLCGWAHQKLVEIHPYWESNGRSSRLLLNLIRMWVGEKPLLFDNDQNYTQAARTLDPQVFALYLKKMKEEQIDLDPLVDQCIKTLFHETVTEQKCDQLMLRALAMPITHLVKHS